MNTDLGNNKDSARVLATIQEIKELRPIKKADKIEVATVMGWNCVVKKGEFEVGDKCVYIEIDALLPIEDKYEFLRQSSYKKADEYNKEGFKLRTARLMGELSQGLALPLGLYDTKTKETLEELPLGADVTQLLNVTKYIEPEVKGGLGQLKGRYVSYSSKTDELRLQSREKLGKALEGKPYYITEKADGTSTTIIYNKEDNKLRAFSRNLEYTLEDDGAMSNLVRRLGLEDKLRTLVENDEDKDVIAYILKGELVGIGIQKNLMNKRQLEILPFTLEKLYKNKETKVGIRQSYDTLKEVSDYLGLETVKLLERGLSYEYTLEELLEKSKGKYDNSDHHREGLVIRLDIDAYNDTEKEDMTLKDREISFKVINNDYLLKKK